MKLTYGYTVKDNSDEYVKIAERAVDKFSVATAPGAYLVDVFPSCKFKAVPNWKLFNTWRIGV